ncbi:MAG: dephospho-CoA kinase [Acidimicrobiia bacterium]
MADQDSRRLAPTVLLGGGIGAGKTRITELFAAAGFLVISSDEVGRQVLAPGSHAVAMVESIWPDVVADSVVDRAALAAHVFEDPAELAHLERITHPAIEVAIQRQVEDTQSPVVIEVPVVSVLSDAAFLRVAVIADESVRLERARARGGDEADIRRRMQRQPTDDQWRSWATHIIENSGSWETTEDQTRRVIDDVMTDG